MSPLVDAMPAKTISARETFIGETDLPSLLAECGNLTDGRSPLYDPVELRAAIMRAFILACCDSMLRFNETRHLGETRISPTAPSSYPPDARRVAGAAWWR